MRVLFTSIYGSHLYGTSNPSSDMDYKQIHMNSTEMLIRGKDSLNLNNNTNNSGRNTSKDVDFESKELRVFIRDCLKGQTYAIDLLHTPTELYVNTSAEWEEILSLKDKLITRHVTPFIGYVKNQASKYSEKGLKYNEIDEVLKQLDDFEDKEALTSYLSVFNLEGLKHFKSYYKEFKNGMGEMYMDGPDCSFPCSRSIKEVKATLKQKLDAFGSRSKEAAKDAGVDLKAYYHALRVIWQLEEYLTKQEIKFPSDRVEDLIAIRHGKYDKQHIEQWISSEVERVLTIPNNLPEPDTDFWDDWLLQKYMKQAYTESAKYIQTLKML